MDLIISRGKVVVFATILLCLYGVHGISYQVEPIGAVANSDYDYNSVCVSAPPGLSCVSNVDGNVVHAFGLPNPGVNCSSAVIKALVGPFGSFWKCIVANLGLPTLTNPERIVIFGNDTLPNGPRLLSPLISSLISLGPLATVEAHFDTEDKEVTVASTDSVNLYCTSDSNQTALFIWEYRNATNGLWRVFSHSQNLTINDVYGELWCSGWSRTGPVKSKSTLVIKQAGATGPLQWSLPMLSWLSSGAPTNVEAQVEGGQSDISVTSVDLVNLSCTSDSNVPAKYIWEYRNATTGVWRVLSHGQYISIRNVFGEVWCTAWNSFGPVRSKSSVTISQIPTFTNLLQMPFLASSAVAPDVLVIASFDSNETEVVGTYKDSFNLSCTSNAWGTVRYIWFYRNNATGELRILSNSQNATIHGLFGEFWCAAWGRPGSVTSNNTLQIFHAPEWVDITSNYGDNTTITVAKTETVLLSCISDAYPAATYRWEKRSNVLKPWKLYTLTQNISLEGKNGEFSCVATNTYGELRSTEVIDLEKPPKLPKLLASSLAEDDVETQGVDSSNFATVVGGVLIAACVVLVVIGVAVTKQRRRSKQFGTYKELKRSTYSRDDDCKGTDEKTSLVMATSSWR